MLCIKEIQNYGLCIRIIRLVILSLGDRYRFRASMSMLVWMGRGCLLVGLDRSVPGGYSYCTIYP